MDYNAQGLHIKPKVHHITVFNDVFLTLYPHSAGVFYFGLATIFHIVII